MQEQIVEDLRTYVRADFEAAFPGVLLAFDNGKIDWNDPPSPFVTFEVEFYDAEQVNIQENPKQRLRGYAYAAAHVRPLEGSKKVRQILDWFSDKLKFKAVGLAQLQAAVPDDGAADAYKDWYCRGIKVPFHATET